MFLISVSKPMQCTDQFFSRHGSFLCYQHQDPPQRRKDQRGPDFCEGSVANHDSWTASGFGFVLGFFRCGS